VYAITGSSLDVGLIGFTGFVPLVAFGLYGGSIADAADRRKLLLVTSAATMLVSVVLLVHAVLQANRISVLFACVAVQAAFTVVDSPARRAIIPQLVRAEKLPAANTLAYGSMQLTVITGPLLAGVAVGAGGFAWAYAIDVASFAGAFYSAMRLPALSPGEGTRRAGLASVVEGHRAARARGTGLRALRRQNRRRPSGGRRRGRGTGCPIVRSFQTIGKTGKVTGARFAR
jgi:MFS family permease